MAKTKWINLLLLIASCIFTAQSVDASWFFSSDKSPSVAGSECKILKSHTIWRSHPMPTSTGASSVVLQPWKALEAELSSLACIRDHLLSAPGSDFWAPESQWQEDLLKGQYLPILLRTILTYNTQAKKPADFKELSVAFEKFRKQSASGSSSNDILYNERGARAFLTLMTQPSIKLFQDYVVSGHVIPKSTRAHIPYDFLASPTIFLELCPVLHEFKAALEEAKWSMIKDSTCCTRMSQQTFEVWMKAQPQSQCSQISLEDFGLKRASDTKSAPSTSSFISTAVKETILDDKHKECAWALQKSGPGLADLDPNKVHALGTNWLGKVEHTMALELQAALSPAQIHSFDAAKDTARCAKLTLPILTAEQCIQVSRKCLKGALLSTTDSKNRVRLPVHFMTSLPEDVILDANDDDAKEMIPWERIDWTKDLLKAALLRLNHDDDDEKKSQPEGEEKKTQISKRCRGSMAQALTQPFVALHAPQHPVTVNLFAEVSKGPGWWLEWPQEWFLDAAVLGKFLSHFQAQQQGGGGLDVGFLGRLFIGKHFAAFSRLSPSSFANPHIYSHDGDGQGPFGRCDGLRVADLLSSDGTVLAGMPPGCVGRISGWQAANEQEAKELVPSLGPHAFSLLRGGGLSEHVVKVLSQSQLMSLDAGEAFEQEYREGTQEFHLYNYGYTVYKTCHVDADDKKRDDEAKCQYFRRKIVTGDGMHRCAAFVLPAIDLGRQASWVHPGCFAGALTAQSNSTPVMDTFLGQFLPVASDDILAGLTSQEELSKVMAGKWHFLRAAQLRRVIAVQPTVLSPVASLCGAIRDDFRGKTLHVPPETPPACFAAMSMQALMSLCLGPTLDRLPRDIFASLRTHINQQQVGVEGTEWIACLQHMLSRGRADLVATFGANNQDPNAARTPPTSPSLGNNPCRMLSARDTTLTEGLVDALPASCHASMQGLKVQSVSEAVLIASPTLRLLVTIDSPTVSLASVTTDRAAQAVFACPQLCRVMTGASLATLSTPSLLAHATVPCLEALGGTGGGGGDGSSALSSTASPSYIQAIPGPIIARLSPEWIGMHYRSFTPAQMHSLTPSNAVFLGPLSDLCNNGEDEPCPLHALSALIVAVIPPQSFASMTARHWTQLSPEGFSGIQLQQLQAVWDDTALCRSIDLAKATALLRKYFPLSGPSGELPLPPTRSALSALPSDCALAFFKPSKHAKLLDEVKAVMPVWGLAPWYAVFFEGQALLAESAVLMVLLVFVLVAVKRGKDSEDKGATGRLFFKKPKAKTDLETGPSEPHKAAKIDEENNTPAAVNVENEKDPVSN